MEHGITVIAVVHILLALMLVVIVLIQDSKGGGIGIGMGGSNQSIFGASGASSFLVKVTRWIAVGFMVTCITLTLLSAKKSNKSVLDSVTTPPTQQTPIIPPPAAPATNP